MSYQEDSVDTDDDFFLSSADQSMITQHEQHHHQQQQLNIEPAAGGAAAAAPPTPVGALEPISISSSALEISTKSLPADNAGVIPGWGGGMKKHMFLDG